MTPARWEQTLRQRSRGSDAPAVDHRRLLRQAHRAIGWRLARAWTVSLLAGALLFVAGAALPDPDNDDDDTDFPAEGVDEGADDEPAEVTLAIVPSGDGSVRITDDDGELDCPQACERTVEQDSAVVLTATPGPAADLVEWGYDDCDDPLRCELTVRQDIELQPRFEPQRWLIVTAGPGAGVVRIQEDEAACDATCRYRFTHGTTVTLEAVEVDDAAFHGWDLAACAGDTTCVVTLDRDTAATATFHAPVELAVTVECSGFRPEGGCGTVQIEPGALHCASGTCPHQVSWGSDLTLTAVAAERFLLLEWGGDCETATVDEDGTTGTCTLTADTDRSVTATFQVRLF